MNPTYVPIVIETQRDCIVQNGRTYCEKSDATTAEVGAVILGSVVFLVWMFGGIWLAVDRDWGARGWLSYFAAPLAVLGIAMVVRMTLEQQLQASVDALACVVKPTVTEEQLHAVHAMLARVCRERVKVLRWQNG